jgi:uncharacterized membrane protein
MYSKAKISGHPIHPALIAFPVALYVSTLVTLIAFQAGIGDAFWYRAACYASLAGVIMAAVAAIPGLIDLLQIPSGSEARRTGITHALLNVSALAVFVVTTVLLWRQWAGFPALPLDARAPLVLAAIGCALTVGAGALGWKLVQTHHIGVDDDVATSGVDHGTLPGTGTRVAHPRSR